MTAEANDAHTRKSHARIAWPDSVIKGSFDVFEVLDESKKDLFGNFTEKFVSQTYKDASQKILDGIRTLDEQTASLIGLKANCLDIPFRIVKLKSVDTKLTRQSSFIALSYCATNEDWIPEQALLEFQPATGGRGYMSKLEPFPITVAMADVVLKERLTSEEGIWVDDCCIDREVPGEEDASKAMVDAIYGTARLVINVLEDVVLDVEESDLLREYLALYERGAIVEKGDDVSRMLTSVFCRIMSARWFSRAWCANEYMWSSRAIFLIGMIEDTGGRSSTGSNERDETPRISTVLRFTSEFLRHLAEVAMHEENTKENTSADDIVIVSGFESAIDFLKKHPFLRMLHFIPGEPAPTSDHRHQSNGASDVVDTGGEFKSLYIRNRGFGATLAKDQLGLALTASSTGLYFKGETNNQQELGKIAQFIAMAASGTSSSEVEDGKNWVML